MSRDMVALSKIEALKEQQWLLEHAIALIADRLGVDIKVHRIDGDVVKVELVEKVRQ
jgi:hypothetical protein